MKKILSLFLILAMLFPSVTVISADNLPSDWAKADVETAEKVALISGDYNFSADITREEFCELAYNYYILNSNDDILATEKPAFDDTGNKHIHLLSSVGIIAGKSEHAFAPHDFLTREEAAAIIFRLINAVHTDWASHELYFQFSDDSEISDWAMNDIQRLCNMGIMSGVGDGKFAPKAHCSTEQTIAMLVRAYKIFNEWNVYLDCDGLGSAAHNYPEADTSGDVISLLSALITKTEDGFMLTGENLEHISWLQIGYSEYRGGFYIGFSMTAKHLLADGAFSSLCSDMVTQWYDGTALDKDTDLANKHITATLNSTTCEIKEVGMERGNNHLDFYFLLGNAMSKKDINELFFEIKVNETNGLSFADKINSQMPTDKNYIFSPLSIKMALSLVANGAEGDTKAEILNALGIEKLDDFNAISKDIIRRYSQSDILKLNIANSVWINKDKTPQNFSNTFEEAATDYYNADIRTTTDKTAVSEINSWVDSKTDGKIAQIIQAPADFWAMLVNAIYFKGAWLDEFDPDFTVEDTFTNADGTKAQTDFMTKIDWLNYAEIDNVQIIELPYLNIEESFSPDGEYIDSKHYRDLDVSMFLIMSDNKDIYFDDVLRNATFNSQYIQLSVPKFKIDCSVSLNEMLNNIGIHTAFDANSAHFEGLFDNGNMYISDAVHKTYIDVDEKGTEAAAVTAVAMAGSALPPQPTPLKFDRPFTFVIRDNVTGESLFMGRYSFAK